VLAHRFAGASGTGKTMSAEVIAAELGVELLRRETLLASGWNRVRRGDEEELERFNRGRPRQWVLLY